MSSLENDENDERWDESEALGCVWPAEEWWECWI